MKCYWETNLLYQEDRVGSHETGRMSKKVNRGLLYFACCCWHLLWIRQHTKVDWIQSQCTKCWGIANFTAYSIELYIKFKKFDNFTNVISWICLCCINRGYYNFMYWRMHEIHSINIVNDFQFKKKSKGV